MGETENGYRRIGRLVVRIILAAGFLLPGRAFGQMIAKAAPVPEAPTAVLPETASRYSIHFQTTLIDQGHARFTAPYTGKNSLRPEPESANSVTATLFLGLRLLPGTELYLDPEMSGGRGMSGARGVAGSGNGETYRIGDAQPVISTARLYLRQTFGFGAETETLADGPNQVAGPAAAHRLMLQAGKFSVADNFDCNAYATDPRTQFMNWSLMSSGAWDFPADTRGYTWGLLAEYHAPDWALRGAAVAEPKEANMLDMDRRIGRAHGLAIEGQHALRFGERKGTARLLAFYNQAHMGNYDESLAQAGTPDVTLTRAYGRSKWGLASSDDLELTGHLGAFMRLSWNDGRNETWAFTEIDASQALGIEFKPADWGRPRDRWGLGAVVNELSGPHRRYLAAGGLGAIIGDGGLHYGPEMILETYYSWQVLKALAVSPDAQFMVNPGYNRSRGPVPVWGLRVHAEF
ncbi:MAG: carbohydrate porin [Elusimicrobia bacterium]|nr:carbohydrate porin [Elusimicrobiota bacterium]